MRDEFSVMFEESDFAEAFKPPPRSRRATFALLGVAALLAGTILALVLAYPQARTALVTSSLVIGLLGAVVLAAALVAALLVAAPSLRKRAARSTLDNHPGMREPVNYCFDPDHFEVRGRYTQARYP